MKKLFETERIRFVEVSEELVPDYLLMVNDPEVNQFLGGTHEAYTAPQETEWVRKKRGEKATVFSMIEKAGGAFIGNIELFNVENGEGELGIAITAKKQNTGYGSEAVPAMIRYGFEKLGLKRIVLRVDPANARAIRVYEKCGFREYRRTDEDIYMELTR